VHSHGDEYASRTYNQSVQPRSVPVQLAYGEGSRGGIVLDRTAGVVTLVGCCGTLLAIVLPWIETAGFGISSITTGGMAAEVPLAILAAGSLGIAGFVLLRRPATAKVAMVLIALATLQVGLAVWFALSIVLAIEHADSQLVLISAIGTGAYLSVLGSALTLVGGVLAWTSRASNVSAE
jgi:hypothetical protein